MTTAVPAERAAVRRAHSLMDLGRWEDGERAARISLAAFPANGQLLGCLSYALYRQQRYDEALDVARQLVAVAPDGEWGYRLAAIALIPLGRTAEACNLARRSVEIDPGRAHAHLYLAHALDAAGRWEEAAAVARRAIALAPGTPDPYARAARIASWRGRRREARALCLEGLRVAPSNVDLILGLTWLDRHRRPLALRARTYVEAAHADPGFGSARAERGVSGLGAKLLERGLFVVLLGLLAVLLETFLDTAATVRNVTAAAVVLVAALYPVSTLAWMPREARAHIRRTLGEKRRRLAWILLQLLCVASLLLLLLLRANAVRWAALAVLTAGSVGLGAEWTNDARIIRRRRRRPAL